MAEKHWVSRIGGGVALASGGFLAFGGWITQTLFGMSPADAASRLEQWQGAMGMMMGPLRLDIWLTVAAVLGACIWYFQSGDPERIVSTVRKMWRNATRDDELTKLSAADQHALNAGRRGFVTPPMPTAAPRAPSQPTLSDEQVLYRGQLRQFVTLIDTAFKKLNQVAALMGTRHAIKQPPRDKVVLYFFRVALRQPIEHMDFLNECARSDVRELNQAFEKEVRDFLQSDYCAFQDYIRTFNIELLEDLGADPTISEWLERERACIEQLKALRASPAASPAIKELSDNVWGFTGERHLNARSYG